MSDVAESVDVEASQEVSLAQPITVSKALSDALAQLYAPFQYTLSEDGSQLVAWHMPGQPPSEADAVAAIAQSKVNWIRAMRVPLFAESDSVALRCFKAAVPFPAEWKTFTQTLRDWTTTPDIPIPTAPTIPTGI